MTALLLFIGTAPIAYIREQVFGILLLEEFIFEHSGCGCWSFDIRAWHWPCQRSFVGYETSHQQVRTGHARMRFIIDGRPISRSEYITIVSIMVCMTVWDFVIGVLFGIIISCKSQIHLISFRTSQPSARFLLRRAKFSTKEHPCSPYWGDRHVCSAEAELSADLSPRSFKAHCDPEASRCAFPWNLSCQCRSN